LFEEARAGRPGTGPYSVAGCCLSALPRGVEFLEAVRGRALTRTALAFTFGEALAAWAGGLLGGAAWRRCPARAPYVSLRGGAALWPCLALAEPVRRSTRALRTALWS
jgi:hypothetical protein